MTRSYFKPTKVKTLEIITPKIYLTEDINLSGLQVTIENQLLNSHLIAANVISSILNVSTVNTLETIAPYFVKQNRLTNITPFNFETNILIPLGVTYSNFATSALFVNYLSGTLLPSISLNSPTAFSHTSLISNLGWFYFLNTGGSNYSPSTYVTEKLSELYFGKTLNTTDGIKGFEKHLFYNYPSYIPVNYTSGTATYTSGTQQIDKLLTLIDVVYSPQVSDEEDYTVKNAFDDYISTKALVQDLESNGPFHKFLKALSYGIHDIDDTIEGINKLYDLEKCPDKYLPLIAELIGWHLFGSDPTRWRLQLRNAVDLYKAKGTKVALQGAIDSIFSEGFLNLSGDINELYESYIPNLIYYSLATESPLFSSFQSWTPALANSLGVTNYSNQSMDVNIRYAVDSILLSLVKRFNSFFKLDGINWNLEDLNFRFRYRNKIHSIPPFEEFKYYKDVEITEDLLKVLVDLIACFGVPSSYLTEMFDFIKSKTVTTSSLLELDNRWLFFYSGLQLPPNYNSILTNFDKTKFRYVGLWSGKSSHFNLTILASSFQYSTKSLDASSTVVLNEALRAINAFAPAHSIPDINFFLESRDYVDYESYECETRDYSKDEYTVSSRVLTNYYTSGANMSSFGRRFGRKDVDSYSDTIYSTSVAIGDLPRTTHRRRNLHNLLPTRNLYMRDGKSMPSVIQPSTTGHFHLGYIPSSNTFTRVTSVTSIPGVYSKCENLNSTSVYNGVTTNDTYPSRGIDEYQISACTHYVRRGDTDRIFSIINKTLYNREKQYWADYLSTSAGFNQYRDMFAQLLDVSTSLANSSFSMSSFSKYENFEFGIGVHKLYNIWSKQFSRHPINTNSLLLSGGYDIFSHVFGPLLLNGKFDNFGSALSTSSQLIASSYHTLYALNNGNGSGVLSPQGSTVGTFTRLGSTANSIHFGGEYVNSSILSKVELINTSGASQENQFSLINIRGSETRPGYSNYLVKNPVIKSKSINGFPRLVYHLSADNNKFIPENEFSLSVTYFAGQENGAKIGGGGVGVWVHTEPQNGMVWSWDPRQSKWAMHTLPSALDVTDVQPYFTTHFTPLSDISGSSTEGFAGKCFNSLTNKASVVTLENVNPELFSNLFLTFNTHNKYIKIPQSYFQPFGQVHTLNQKYVVEVFKLPSPDTNSYILFDEVSIINTTLNDYTWEYDKSDLLYILIYFKSIADARASRNPVNTSGEFYTSGGSRINYRNHPFWHTYVVNSNNQVSSLKMEV